MILNGKIALYQKDEGDPTLNQGIPTFTYSKFAEFGASVQPASLSEQKLAEWGITTLVTDSKIIFIPGNVNIPQSWLVIDLNNQARYQVRGSNPWPRHTEILVEPWQGQPPI